MSFLIKSGNFNWMNLRIFGDGVEVLVEKLVMYSMLYVQIIYT
jgi:hypothetical protein